MRKKTYAFGKEHTGSSKVLAISVLLFDLGGNYKMLLCYSYLKYISTVYTLMYVYFNKKIIREYSFIQIHL